MKTAVKNREKILIGSNLLEQKIFFCMSQGAIFSWSIAATYYSVIEQGIKLKPKETQNTIQPQ